MFPNIITTISRMEKTVLFSGLALLTAASAFQQKPHYVRPAFHSVQPLRPLGPDAAKMRSGLKDRLLLAAAGSNVMALEIPPDLGHLVRKGKINPDGSEVWGYPEGSDLDGVVEIHVRDGRVVREVLRPSAQPSDEAVASALSDSSEPDAVR